MTSVPSDWESVAKPKREATFLENPRLQAGQLVWRLQQVLHHISAHTLAAGTTQMLM